MSKKNGLLQISNVKTVDMYKRQYVSLAMNVFNIVNLDEIAPFMDYSYINYELVYKGRIAFFMDEYLGLLALPFMNVGKLDLYGRPIDIQVMGRNGYTRILHPGEYVIMYDNRSKQALIYDILQYAERISLIQRTMDINISQQRTPRFWRTKTENKKTIEDVINGVSANDEAIVVYDNLNIDDTTLVLAPAPFVADKLSEQKDKLWNEFLRLIGIANSSFQKKERNIRDEIFISQAGTIASRFTRFNSRVDAINKMNKMWSKKYWKGLKLDVEYYDGLPTTLNIEGGVTDDGYVESKDDNTSESDNSGFNNES